MGTIVRVDLSCTLNVVAVVCFLTRHSIDSGLFLFVIVTKVGPFVLSRLSTPVCERASVSKCRLTYSFIHRWQILQVLIQSFEAVRCAFS